MNRVIISTDRQPVICGCGFLAASEPFFHADRVLDFNILIYVVEGTIYVTEEDTDHELAPGELLFLKKGLHHFGKREIERGTKWYYAHFYLDEPQDEPSGIALNEAPLGVDEPLRTSAALPKKLTGLHGSGIERAIADFTEYCASADPFKRMRINNMFHSLLTDIALMGQDIGRDSTLSGRICAWLDDHISEPFSAQRLEHEFFLSYKRMAAVFVKEQGIPMQRYHTARRMARACTLLRSTLLPIGEIADLLGYDDALYFSRTFHSVVGTSPRNYRLSAKADY